MQTQIQRDLTRAVAARRSVAVSALRSALAAIANAQAVESPSTASTAHPTVAGSAGGLGATEAERRSLSDLEVARLVRAEVDERLSAAASYDRLGRADRAEQLRAEAAVLSEYLSAH